MTRFLRIIVDAWLVSLALAAPGLEQRAACNADNCLRAVRATNRPQPNASADCASFLRKTVTPCPTTTTTTQAVTVTAPASTSTVTQIVQDISIDVDFQPFTSIVTTIEDVIGSTATEVVVVSSTQTVTVTVGASSALLKNRQAGTSSSACKAKSTCPATGGASVVPTYASACSGTARYSSACSCFGVTAETVTAAQSTSTATTTSVVTVVPTVTVTAQRTQLSVVTDVQPTIVPATFETTVTSVVATVPVTQVSAVTATQTVTASCTTYAPYATNGAFAGHALGSTTAGILAFEPGMANPQLLVIQADGYLRDLQQPELAAAVGDPVESIVFFALAVGGGSTPLKCRVGDPLNQSGIFPLYCDDGGVFQTCGTSPTLYRAQSVDSGCTIADLGVFKACTTPFT